MNNYPKIYSISTVGIRQHGNADFLLHSVRTDFVGNNHLGKSIIADLLQLIFVPLRDEWKPGTEGFEDRKIETIPLNRDWITHAYCFLNIEKTQGKFLTIGVYIPTNPRVPIRSFIVQKGEDFEDKKNPLKTFDRPLVAADFIEENQKIYDIKELNRHIFENYGLYFKDFYQKEGINDYFDWLYKNHILPIDLTKETNLKSFAKILQSFSKAKTLKITDSRSLQDFLFEDNNEIKATFNNKRDELTRHISDYHKTDKDIKSLKKKQDELGKLKTTFEKYEDTKKTYLLKNANLLLQIKSKAEKNYNDNETTKINSLTEYKKAKELYEIQCKDLYAKMLEQKAICVEIRDKLETEQAETGTNDVQKLQAQIQKESVFIESLRNLQSIVQKHKSVEIIKEKLDEQEKIKEKKKKLEALQKSPYFEKFEKSEWIKGYESAYKYYNEYSITLNVKIDSKKELLSLYDGNNPDSFFNWAVNQKSELTIEQETVLMAFKDIFTKQIETGKGKKYSLNPQSLINSFEKKENGIWVVLGDLREYFPLIEKQMFNNKSKLEQALANNKEQIEKEIKQHEAERTEITNLNNELIKIGLNEELINIYTNRNQLENYQLENLLTEENVLFIEQNFSQFSQTEKLQIKVDALIKRIENSGTIKSNLGINKDILGEISDSIEELKQEILNPIETYKQNWQSFTKEELVSKRQEYKTLIKNLSKENNTTKSTRDTQKNRYDSANNQTESLKTTKETAENNFTTAKQNFEREIFLNFDEQLQMGELTEETVNFAKNEYETAKESYRNEYAIVANSFDESKAGNKNPELYDNEGKSYYDYKTLEKVLCGSIGLNNVTNKLSELNEKLITFAEFQMTILTNVFGLVERQYKEYDNTVNKLNFFFEKQKISDIFQFKVEFEPRKDINIDWIDQMRERSKVHKEGADLFTLPENLPSAENTPENLIKTIANTFYRNAKADVPQLLNPKFYFTLNATMEDEAGNKNSGSSGQTYTALALLCIGRLSIVQKEQHQGLKFIILEELLNLDDTNFNIFPKIARNLGYQLITMTTKPFGSYTNEEWFLHMLLKGKENTDENYTPMSLFKTKTTKTDLNIYIQQQNELETV